MAYRLHQAGYTAEVYLGKQEPASFMWLVDIQSQPPQITLTSQSKKQNFEVKDTGEVLALLGEEGIDKDSAT